MKPSYEVREGGELIASYEQVWRFGWTVAKGVAAGHVWRMESRGFFRPRFAFFVDDSPMPAAEYRQQSRVLSSSTGLTYRIKQSLFSVFLIDEAGQTLVAYERPSFWSVKTMEVSVFPGIAPGDLPWLIFLGFHLKIGREQAAAAA